MKYTISQFKKDFPNDDACLDYVFKARFSGFICPKCGKDRFYRIKGRKSYACRCGYQIHPVSGTIFHKSDTKLTDWFFAVYLMSQSMNGVSAKEIQRYLGTTYKTAWRIAHKIRSLMKDWTELDKIVEVDEAYIGGKRRMAKKNRNKSIVLGMVKRGGGVKAQKIDNVETQTILNLLRENIKQGTYLMTDDSSVYKKTKKFGYSHSSIKHSKKKYVFGDIHTNTIEEGFWSQIKRSMAGTYHSISAKHLQAYINEFAYRYNHRFSSLSIFHSLLSRLCGQHDLRVQKSVPLKVEVSS